MGSTERSDRDRKGFGNDTAAARVLFMRVAGVVFVAVPVAAVMTEILTFAVHVEEPLEEP